MIFCAELWDMSIQHVTHLESHWKNASLWNYFSGQQTRQRLSKHGSPFGNPNGIQRHILMISMISAMLSAFLGHMNRILAGPLAFPRICTNSARVANTGPIIKRHQVFTYSKPVSNFTNCKLFDEQYPRTDKVTRSMLMWLHSDDTSLDEESWPNLPPLAYTPWQQIDTSDTCNNWHAPKCRLLNVSS